jgi:hypothetical protein
MYLIVNHEFLERFGIANLDAWKAANSVIAELRE